MVIKSMYPPLPEVAPCNVVELLFNRQDQKEWKGDHTLHIDSSTGRKRTFRQFVARVSDGSSALGASVAEGGIGLTGTGPQEIIGIMGPNSMELIALIITALSITTPFALLSTYYTRQELSHALKLSKTTRLFVHPSYLALARRAARGLIPDERIYLIEGSALGKESFGDMITRTREIGLRGGAIRKAERDTLAYLIFSSGTSGTPKAVMISHGNIAAALLQGIVYAQATAEVYVAPPPPTAEGYPVAIGVLPMHHTYGLHAFAFRPFLAPCTIVLVDQWNVSSFLKLVPKYKATYLALIPSIVHQMVNSSEFKKTDLSSLQAVSSGAAYLPPQLSNEFTDIVSNHSKVVMTEGYGMSETTLSVTAKAYPGSLQGRVKDAPGSAGVLLPGLEARIVRDDGLDADVNEAGDLWVRGRCIALGYWDNEAATTESFIDGGWLKTGDRFRIDENGSFFFEDRAKDTLKISGMQVSPAEIENALLDQPDRYIVDCAVCGVSGGRTVDEKVPRAWIVLSAKGLKQDPNDVIKVLDAHCRKVLSKYKRLRGGIEIINEIPKSPTGKVLRRVLQDEFERKYAVKTKL